MKNKRFFAVLAVLMLATVLLSACSLDPEYNISGSVLDIYGADPLADYSDVEIIIKGPQIETITIDELGQSDGAWNAVVEGRVVVTPVSETYDFVETEIEVSRFFNRRSTIRSYIDDEQDFAGGEGTDEDPYLIVTPDHLDAIRDFDESHFLQLRDIALEDFIASMNDGDEGWEPVDIDFGDGSYDGDEYSIKNLYINRPKSERQGLFGSALGNIKNIRLEDIDINGGNDTGGLVGYYRAGEINNCQVISGEIFSGEAAENTGGLVGRGNRIDIIEAQSQLEVQGDKNVGGIIGNLEDGTVSDSSSRSSVLGMENIGGLIGSFSEGLVIDSSSEGTIAGLNNDSIILGGLVGLVHEEAVIESSSSYSIIEGLEQVGGIAGNNRGEIYTSYARADITGDYDVGGLVGLNEYYITASYSQSVVRGNTFVGGLAGYNDAPGSIMNTYSSGEIIYEDDNNDRGDKILGGLVGDYDENSEIISSYYDKQAAGLDNEEDDEEFARTTEKMQQQDTYEGWDFEEVWNIEEGSSYPYLFWE